MAKKCTSRRLDALTHLYPKLSPGGYLVVDGYHAVPRCKQAVYTTAPNIASKIQFTVDWAGAYWHRRA
jgi:hypothetical protein